MKILVLTSRYTATRDIISEDFGRQMRLCEELVKLGHSIDMFVADYRKHESKQITMHGIDITIRPFAIRSFFSFYKEFLEKARSKKYDVLIASSDPLWGVVGLKAKKQNLKMFFLYDLHDNYETYDMYRIPFFRFFDRNAMKKADVITTITHQLKKKIERVRSKNVFVIENGVDRAIFRPLDKKKCRKDLKLPQDKRLIVYTGSIQRYEGVHRLLSMFSLLKKEKKDCILVIAGRYAKGEEKYIDVKQENVIYLGSLSQKDVAKVINAGDVAIVPYTNNWQVTYGFPYKLVEYMACQVPIVATRVGDNPKVLKNKQFCLCSPDSLEDMKQKTIKNMELGRINYEKDLKELTWKVLAKKIDLIIKNA